MVSARKARLSGKRKVIDGESLITTVEKLNAVRDVEWTTRQRGAKKQKVFKGWGSGARSESTDQSEVESDDNNEGVVKTFDCIEVQI